MGGGIHPFDQHRARCVGVQIEVGCVAVGIQATNQAIAGAVKGQVLGTGNVVQKEFPGLKNPVKIPVELDGNGHRNGGTGGGVGFGQAAATTAVEGQAVGPDQGGGDADALEPFRGQSVDPLGLKAEAKPPSQGQNGGRIVGLHRSRMRRSRMRRPAGPQRHPQHPQPTH